MNMKILNELFSFKGSINRGKLWGYSLLLTIPNIIFLLAAISSSSESAMVIYLVYTLIFSVASISLTVRRLRDIGRPGLHYFLLYIPFYNFYLSILLGFKKGIEVEFQS